MIAASVPTTEVGVNPILELLGDHRASHVINPATEDVFDFGITDVLQVSRAEHALFIAKFTCGCFVVVGGGHILLWPGRVAAVCEHVRSLLGQDFR